MIAQASTTFESGSIAGDFGGAIVGQVFQEVRATLKHAPHGAPVGMAPNQPFHNQRVALNIERNFSASLEIQPFPHRFGNVDLPFRRHGCLGHELVFFYQGKTDSHPAQVEPAIFSMPIGIASCGLMTVDAKAFEARYY